MRAVLDTNILLSALITPDGVPSRIVDAWFEDRFELLTHELQLAELRTVTRRDRIRPRLRPVEAGRLMNRLHANALFVDRLPGISRSDDPADDFLLALCEASGADYLVTGDKVGLLALGRHGRTAIVTERHFLNVLQA
jgi:putative PIN family toxin of toxin-antitoxin system